MSSIGLQGIPLLARLDDTGMSLWKLYFLFVAVSLFATLVLSPTAYLVNTESAMARFFTFELTLVKLLINSLLIGFTVFCCIALARTTEADIKLLSDVDSGVGALSTLLRADQRTIVIAVSATTIALLAFSPINHALNQNLTLVDSVKNHAEAGIGPWIIFLPMPLLLGSAIGLATAIVIQQIRTLLQVAREINIELLNLDHYTAIASPFIRYVTIVLFAFSGFPPLILLDDPTLSSGLSVVGVLMLLVYVPILTGYFIPIFILRNRIRDAKRLALNAITQARSGDQAVLDSLKMPHGDLPAPDLLTQQMFLEARWEWPIASHLQKLILFGMLPPLTWVLAALVENILF